MNADTTTCEKCGAAEKWITEDDGTPVWIGYECMYEVEACAYAEALRSLATRLRDALAECKPPGHQFTGPRRDGAHERACGGCWYDRHYGSVLADADALLSTTKGHDHA